MTRGTRIAFVSHSPRTGGAERAFANFITNLPDSIQPVAIFPMLSGPIQDEVRNAGIPTIELDYDTILPSTGDLFHLHAMEEKARVIEDRFTTLFKELELDAVVVNTNALSAAVYAAAKLELPVVLHSHGMISQRLYGRLNASLWSFEDPAQMLSAMTVICPSQMVADLYVDFYGVPRESIEVIPNGTHCSTWSEVETESEGPLKFVMLCSLEVNKNVLMFAEAAKRLRDDGLTNFEFHIYGEGDPAYASLLADFIWEARLGKIVYIHKKSTKINEIYDSAAAVIVTSQLESFSFVTIEAMSRGRPVVATRCGGPEAIIDDGVTGFLIEKNNVSALAEKIKFLAENREVARQMGNSGRELAESRYEIRYLANLYANRLLEVVDGATHDALTNKRHIAMRHTGLKRAVTMPLIGHGATYAAPMLITGQSSVHKARAIEFAEYFVGMQHSRIHRFRRRFLGKEDLWASVSREFDDIVRFISDRGMRDGTRLLLSDDLRSVPYREYRIDNLPLDFHTVSTAVSISVAGMSGIFGMELVDEKGEIVSHETLPVSSIDSSAPVSIPLRSAVKGGRRTYFLRLFAKDCEGPIWVYEVVRDRLAGLLPARKLPFVSVT